MPLDLYLEKVLYDKTVGYYQKKKGKKGSPLASNICPSHPNSSFSLSLTQHSSRQPRDKHKRSSYEFAAVDVACNIPECDKILGIATHRHHTVCRHSLRRSLVFAGNSYGCVNHLPKVFARFDTNDSLRCAHGRLMHSSLGYISGVIVLRVRDTTTI